MQIRTKRIYDEAAKNDGYRVLVDRVWPRGVSKEEADVDCWAKDVAPSTDLRKWFGHDADKWEEFEDRYRKELEKRSDELEKLLNEADKKRITLLYGAKDTRHNHAIVLKNVLQEL